MKMMSLKMMALLGLGMIGYIYLKNNPKMMEDMKNKEKEMIRNLYNFLDEQE
ncbi:MAG: hypothetical protein IJG68_00295 [Bacilli bacterium]|nr:hypothetical protein [Bacilli bacterium]